MGWTLSGTGWQNYDWQSVALIQELWSAYRERQSPGGSLPEAGDDFQNITIYKTIQDWIASYCGGFVRSHTDYATPRTPSYYNNGTVEMWSFANLCTAAGVIGGDFRQATTIPTDWTDFGDAAYSAGRFSAGEIIGPWLPFDIQRMLNMLIWTRSSYPPFGNMLWIVDVNKHNSGYSGFIYTSLADAKAVAEAEFDSGVNIANWSSGHYAQSSVSFGGGVYQAGLYRRIGKCRIVNLPTSAAKEVNFFFSAGPAGSGQEWDANGDPFFEYSYGLWSTVWAPAASSSVESEWTHSDVMSKPNWPIGINITRGYQEHGTYQPQIAIIRWNVTDGFAYV